MSAVLEARALAFGHRGKALGDALDLDVQAGEVLCLLGPNGCGKTTLFRTLLGLLPALGGHVRIDGHDVAGRSRRDLAQRVAYVPQAHAGTFAYSVEDVVLMGRAARIGAFSTPSAADRRVAGDAVEHLGIAHLSAARYTEISGGERQLVLVARALAQQAPLLVMDEPTANLDFGNQLRVLRQVESLRGQGVAVLLSTHDPAQGARVASRVAMMRAGRIVGIGPPRQVVTRASLCALYGLQPGDLPAGMAAI